MGRPSNMDQHHHFAFSINKQLTWTHGGPAIEREEFSGTWRDIRRYCRSVGEVRRLSRNPKLRCLHVPSGKYVQFITLSLWKLSYIFASKTTSTHDKKTDLHQDWRKRWVQGLGRGGGYLPPSSYKHQRVMVTDWYMHPVGANTTTWTSRTKTAKWKTCEIILMTELHVNFLVHNLVKHEIQNIRIQSSSRHKNSSQEITVSRLLCIWTMLLDSNVYEHHHHHDKSINVARSMYKIPVSASGR